MLYMVWLGSYETAVGSATGAGPDTAGATVALAGAVDGTTVGTGGGSVKAG